MEHTNHHRRGLRLPHHALLLVLIGLTAVATTPAAALREHRDDNDASGGGGSGSGCDQAASSASPVWVFGDSYADTGNLGDLGRELTRAWYDPYGVTFPGHPTGRFSDGRVLTDSIASAMGVPTPVAYKLRRGAARGLTARGMNFAVGGAGVLDTGNFQRNIAAQIDLFLAQHPRPARGCDAGVAVVVVSGNDYSYAADKDNSTSAAIAYIPTVVRQLREQLRRLRDEAGMRKVVVTNLHPMGCTPLFTRALNYTACDALGARQRGRRAAQRGAPVRARRARPGQPHVPPPRPQHALRCLRRRRRAAGEVRGAEAAVLRELQRRRPLWAAGRRRQEAVHAVWRPKQAFLLGRCPPDAGRMGCRRPNIQAQDSRVYSYLRP